MHQKYDQIGPGINYFLNVMSNAVRNKICNQIGGLYWHKQFNSDLYLAAGNLICAIYTIIFIKLWSYAQVNYWCRTSFGSKIGGATFDGRQITNRNNSMIELNPNPPTSKQIGI